MHLSSLPATCYLLTAALSYPLVAKNRYNRKMSQSGVYLYGFIPGALYPDLSAIEGVDGSRPIRTIDVGGSTAVVGEVSIEAFEAAMSSGIDGGPDPSWILPRALRHEAVLDALLARSPVLPARFGTLFSSPEALASLAGAHQAAIAGFFESIGDRLEWSLRGYYDPARAVDLLLASDPELSRRRAALPESPGLRYFQEKRLIEEARWEGRRAATLAADGIRRALRAIAQDARSLPTRGSEGPTREMVLHETFLMSAQAAAGAIATIREAADSPVEGLLTLEPSGPWPPFHFCPDLGGPSA
jgi:hypothetical protein